jgi:predicted aspartyl protease
VNASDSLWFILDTGAMGNVINRSTADRLKLGFSDQETSARGATGHAPAAMVEGATIRLAGIELTDRLPLTAISLDALALKTGHPCDGIIGAPFFQRAVVELDYAGSRLVVHEQEGWTYAGKGTSFPLTFESNHPYMTAKVTPPGGEPVEGRWLLDTGSTMSLILSPDVVKKTKAVERAPRTVLAVMGGVGGQARNPMGRVEKLELGPYALERPLAIFRAPGPGSTSVDGSVGNLGGEVLRRFTVTFDYANARMYLEPNTAFAEPFEGDMTGLVLTPQDDGKGGVEVQLVQADSPAAEQGVKAGDVLETVDGSPLVASGLVDLRKSLRQPGRTLRLGFRRGDERTAVTLTTRRIL